MLSVAKDFRVGQAPVSVNSIVEGYVTRLKISNEDWRPTEENLTWLAATS